MSASENTARRPRVLMIAPQFYPCQVIGAHRSGKFCKYLPSFGYDVSVLTVDPVKAGWAVDQRLLQQIPAETRRIEAFYPYHAGMKKAAHGLVQKLKGWCKPLKGKHAAQAGATTPAEGLAWLGVPDKDMLWVPWALKSGLEPARHADIIYATGPNFSTLLVGAMLKRIAGRPLVIDLRDPWTISELKRYPSTAHRYLDACLEWRTFRAADAIICNTQAVRTRYERLYPELPAARFTVITNGYDDDDFANLPRPSRAPGKVRVGYFGKVYGGREPGPLFQAARQAVDAGLIAPGTLEFVFYGPSGDIVANVARAAGVEEMVSLKPMVPYAEALREMAGCDVLLIIGSPETDALHIPGKAFEYLAIRKPILTLAGPGALGDLMKQYHFGLRVSPADSNELVPALKALCDDILAGRAEKYLGDACANLSRRGLTGELAAIFDRLCPGRNEFSRPQSTRTQAGSIQ